MKTLDTLDVCTPDDLQDHRPEYLLIYYRYPCTVEEILQEIKDEFEQLYPIEQLDLLEAKRKANLIVCFFSVINQNGLTDPDSDPAEIIAYVSITDS